MLQREVPLEELLNYKWMSLNFRKMALGLHFSMKTSEVYPAVPRWTGIPSERSTGVKPILIFCLTGADLPGRLH